jgi:hypothetical protein
VYTNDATATRHLILFFAVGTGMVIGKKAVRANEILNLCNDFVLDTSSMLLLSQP